MRIKLNSDQIASLLEGKEVEAKDITGQAVKIIASDDGVNVYRNKINKALDNVERDIYSPR